MQTSNINTFISNLNKDIKKVQEDQKSTARVIVLTAYSGIIQGTTAVDTGLMKNSNILTINKKTKYVNKLDGERTPKDQPNPNIVDKDTIDKSKKRVKTIEFNDKDKIYIQNNVEYAYYIETLGNVNQDAGLYKRVAEQTRDIIRKAKR